MTQSTSSPPVESGMVERVARAMCDEINFSFDGFNDATRDKYMRMARAAIEAMREPTIEQTEAVRIGSRQQDTPPLPSCKEIWAAEFVWRTMIDAALNEDIPA